MAIKHMSSGEVVNVRSLGDELDQTSTNAFFKDPHLEVMRIFYQPASVWQSMQWTDRLRCTVLKVK